MFQSAIDIYAKEGDKRNWWVYHDALSQITDKECVAYMTEQKYYDHLIKPDLGCNAGTIYEGRLVGNSPELNPLDCSLFADLTHALTLHICLTEKSLLYVKTRFLNGGKMISSPKTDTFKN